ncbi:unnamed protein product [Bathycoccus prasinos]
MPEDTGTITDRRFTLAVIDGLHTLPDPLHNLRSSGGSVIARGYTLSNRKTNAICLDYDIYDPNRKDKQKYTLEYFKKVCGDDVYISRTPSGGYHAVFRYEARFDTWKNATIINGFIDIRTTGGYICGNRRETETAALQIKYSYPNAAKKVSTLLLPR